jgi:hypothetical protein
MSITDLHLAREYLTVGADRTLRRQFANGFMTRLAPGVYVESPLLKTLAKDEQYRLRVLATAQITDPGTQFSHDSAAAMWRLPSFGVWSPRIHARAAREGGGRSGAAIQRHGIGLDPYPVTIDDLSVTSLERTVVDIAMQSGFFRAVGMMDDALRAPVEGDFRHALGLAPANHSDIRALVATLGKGPGSNRARLATEFATPLSGSLGESLSRCQFHILGIPTPELQVPFWDEEGLIGYADFYWRHLDLIGEFDGDLKYGADRQFQRDISARQVLLDEKRREDRMRRVVRSFTRWGWDTALDRRKLAAHLHPFGLASGR